MRIKLIFWEITRACNLRCPHCRAQTAEKPLDGELTTREVRRIIAEIASFSQPILVFSGGEPLIRKDLFGLLEFANLRGLKTAVATNASLISGEVADKLKEAGVSIVSVSIYGGDEKSHDGFCGESGAFQKSLKGISNLKESGISFQINTTVTKKNLSEIESIARFSSGIGAEAYHVFFLVPTGRGKFIKGDAISPSEYEDAFERIYDLSKSFPLRVKATCAPHYQRVLRQQVAEEREKKGFSPELSGKGDREGRHIMLSKGCLAGQGVCFISCTGEVYGCGYLGIPAGDLKEQDFKSIWSGSELFNILRDDSKLKGKCAVCEFKKVCGGCRARAYASTGDFLEEEPSCIYQPGALLSNSPAT